MKEAILILLMALTNVSPNTVVVTATVYQAKEQQCDSDPYTTAFGYKIDPSDPIKHRYVAVSKDLEEIFQPGDSVLVTGTHPYNDTTRAVVYDGMWIVADRMHPRWRKKIDLLISDDSFIDSFNNVTISKIKGDVRKRATR